MQLKSILSAILLFFFCFAYSQKQNSIDLALRALEQHVEADLLSNKDIENPLVSDLYTSVHNGVTHVYLNQTIDGISINNAITAISIKNGKVLHAPNHFIKDARKLVRTNKAKLDAESAIFSALKEMEISTKLKTLTVKERRNENNIIFSQPDFSDSDVTSNLVYQLNENNQLILAWDFTIDMKSNSDYWSVRVDAQTGKIINKHNYTIYCSHDHGGLKNQNHSCGAHEIVKHKYSFKSTESAIAMADATYNVFELPTESPLYGVQTLVEDPQLIIPGASPLGWHQTPTNSYTITRGNNVWAYTDKDFNNISDGDEPDGGSNLVFNYPYNPNAEPDQMNDLTHVNLFYVSNLFHDIAYALGFNEVAGNFQQSNFGLGGAEGDYIAAEGQDGFDTNNANFSVVPDGEIGRLQMFLWENESGLLKVTSPSQLEGFYDAGVAFFGPNVVTQNVNVIGQCVAAFDGNDTGGGSETDGCSSILNDIDGKIALIDRGFCDFSEKAYNAQEAGAIAVLVCNIPGASTAGDDGNEPFDMGAGISSNLVTIPSLGVGKSTCDAIKLSLSAEIPVEVHIANHEIEGPELLDGDFDNGIIVHELAHGISIRLTGGPGSANCLGNAEQMGEGWSDFFTLIMTAQNGDQGADPRGIGNFADGQTANGKGIRNYPYSTDMDINPQTYDDIKNKIIDGAPWVHGIGEVWGAMIWDLYWAFVDIYGWDGDWNNKESGNYKAALLVMDGMKIQGCSPGFVDGRDAILAADVANFNGEHQCLIWEVFARRGLGYFAQQGSANSQTDGVENFEILPTCIQELKIIKGMTKLIAAGDNVEVKLTVTNHIPSTVTNVVVTDELPAGLQYIDGTASTAANVVGDMISFELGDMAYEDEIIISYSAKSDPTNKSSSIKFFDMEDLSAASSYFEREAISETVNFWNIVSSDSYSPIHSWFVESSDEYSDQTVKSKPFTVSGAKPTLKFWHKWNTQTGVDGGLVEISTNGDDWTILDEEFFENGYSSELGYVTLGIPNLSAFSGQQTEWIASFADLSNYMGQEVQIRFRYACDNDIIPSGVTGWFFDNFEIMNLVSYEGAACVTANEVTEPSCSDAQAAYVESEEVSAVVGVEEDHFGFAIFPNPANQLVHINISSKTEEKASIGIYSLDGRQARTITRKINEQVQTITFDIQDLASGIYLVKVETTDGAITEKLIIN